MAERVTRAREANQQFLALLAATERDGLTVVITRRGRVVARLVPESGQAKADVNDRSFDALFERYSRRMGGQPFSREDLYDRGEVDN